MALKISLISVGMAGVDMRVNPLFLPDSKLHSATNMEFDEGVVRTRQGFKYHDLGVQGRYHGGASYSPSRGLSHQPFSDPIAAFVYFSDGRLIYNLFNCGEPTKPYTVEGKDCGCRLDDVYLFQAENYLIGQTQSGSTFWWEGWGKYHCSPGLSAPQELVQELVCEIEERHMELTTDHDGCCFHKMEYCKLIPTDECDYLHSSHDSFCMDKHRHFLVNSAGLGAYAHGRIHQQGQNKIYVSDIIHKRGHLLSDDILLMEEQMLESYGDPLSTNSKMGQMRALQVLPATNTANGEGELVAYYDYGVVSYNTFQFPRETRHDGNGKTLVEGWSEKRMVSHLLNTISAVGRYAVAILPRDHAFRSKYGLHFLRSAIGVETHRDEAVNMFSQDVQPLLDMDDAKQLRGAAVGHWVGGSRIFATVGLHDSFAHSTTSMGRGFVSYNQASSFTEDRTPRPLWEGLWLMDSHMEGIHQFVNISEPTSYDTFGFACSDSLAGLFFAEPKKHLKTDLRGGEEIPIEWSVVTRQESAGGLRDSKTLGEGRLECIFGREFKKLRVMVRTDRQAEWKLWNEFTETAKLERGETAIKNFTLGQPPIDYREATWYQFKVEGVGHVEIRDFEIIVSPVSGKSGGSNSCRTLKHECEDPFEINTKPESSRW